MIGWYAAVELHDGRRVPLAGPYRDQSAAVLALPAAVEAFDARCRREPALDRLAAFATFGPCRVARPPSTPALPAGMHNLEVGARPWFGGWVR